MTEIIAAILALFVGFGCLEAAPAAFETPEVSCQEDEPCWRWYMGNGTPGPDAPPYMWLPEGSEWDAIAPLYGYIED
ncbi:hypothetical protein ACWF99_23680 [Nocardia sp. NPDC055002]